MAINLKDAKVGGLYWYSPKKHLVVVESIDTGKGNGKIKVLARGKGDVALGGYFSPVGKVYCVSNGTTLYEKEDEAVVSDGVQVKREKFAKWDFIPNTHRRAVLGSARQTEVAKAPVATPQNDGEELFGNRLGVLNELLKGEKKSKDKQTAGI